jgi:hypothetical protein
VEAEPWLGSAVRAVQKIEEGAEINQFLFHSLFASGDVRRTEKMYIM